MKLQKLLYLSHGYYLATTTTPWIDEAFEAWDYGPVVPSIYHEFKRFGSSSIGRGARCTALIHEPSGFRWETPEGATDHDDIGGQVVNWVLNTYGGKSAIYLSELTHKVGSPWEVIRQNTGNARNQDIPNEAIREYFGNLIKA
jgi:uncharacterized phage-associated protein